MQRAIVGSAPRCSVRVTEYEEVAPGYWYVVWSDGKAIYVHAPDHHMACDTAAQERGDLEMTDASTVFDPNVVARHFDEISFDPTLREYTVKLPRADAWVAVPAATKPAARPPFRPLHFLMAVTGASAFAGIVGLLFGGILLFARSDASSKLRAFLETLP